MISVLTLSFQFLQEFLETGSVNLHAMWFDIYEGEMYFFSKEKQRFILIDEETIDELSEELARKNLI